MATVRAHEQAKANRRTIYSRSMMKAMPVTSAIVGANVLVYLAMTLSGASPMDPSTADLARWGANTGLQTLIAQPWRMWTSNYVHIGIIHIALNMWCLWSLGVLAERIFDRWTYFLTYACCGIAGSLASLGLHPHRYGAGASGAIFGLAGALISALYLGHLPINPRALKSTLKSLVLFAIYNLSFGAVVPAIDNSAHMGGLVCGLVLGAVLAKHLTSPPDERTDWNRWIFIVAAIVLIAVFFVIRRSVLESAVYRPIAIWHSLHRDCWT
ncbi:MAG TPA: rhomboid family intramembrane serine protease [Terriglobales bacterium]|jgi:rhomboid protease GluP